MVLRQQIWEGARTFVQLQVCNKANCLPYPFCSYHRDKNHAPKAKKGLPPARASFLVNSICSHSFPLKFAAVVFRFVAFSGALEMAGSCLSGVKCPFNLELYTNLEPQPESWKFDQKESMLYLPAELKLETEMSCRSSTLWPACQCIQDNVWIEMNESNFKTGSDGIHHIDTLWTVV